jgi:hypothetical protein
MAQAKTRASTKRPSRKRSSPKRSPTRAKSKAAASSRSSNGKTRIKAVRRSVEHTAKDAGKTVSSASKTMGKAASKAKTPLLAGGAALAGAAGGMAIGAMRSRHSHSHKVLGVKMPQPKRVKISSRDVARAAKEVGTFGQHVGELATELRHAREESGNGHAKHRSPVEVVLDGLTARR